LLAAVTQPWCEVPTAWQAKLILAGKAGFGGGTWADLAQGTMNGGATTISAKQAMPNSINSLFFFI
jgi:hypothetical protein